MLLMLAGAFFAIPATASGAAPETNRAGEASKTLLTPERRPETSTRLKLILAGSATLGAAYIIPTGIAAGSGFPNHSGWLALPVAGPWVFLAERERCRKQQDGLISDGCLGDGLLTFAVVLDGLAQLTGVILLTHGLLRRGDEATSQPSAHRIRPFAGWTGRDGFGALSVDF